MTLLGTLGIKTSNLEIETVMPQSWWMKKTITPLSLFQRRT
jgi:hypothetical protein